MITKLPIVIDYHIINNSKIIFHNFKIIKKNNQIILDIIHPYKKLNFIKIPCVNNYNCINYLKIALPLKINIIDNMLLTPYFFVISMQSNNNSDLDFFNLLITFLNNNKSSIYKFLDNNNFSNYSINILKYCNKFNINNNYQNINSFITNFYIYVNILLNTGLFINYLHDDFTNKDLKALYGEYIKKKIIFVVNSLRSYKFSYKMSSKFELREHIKNFNNLKVEYKNIKKNFDYFVFIDNKKLLKINILDKNENNILTDKNKFNFNKYDIYYYPPLFKNLLNKNGLFNHFTNNYLFDLIINKIVQKNKLIYYENIIKYFKNDEYINEYLHDIVNLNIEFNEIEDEYVDVLKDDYEINKSINLDINDVNFKNILNKNNENKIKILILLFKNYTFPIQYNKRKLDKVFEKILYISFLNYNLIIDKVDNKFSLKDNINNHIPLKLKTLYINLLKIYIQFIEDNSFSNILYNPKIYNDYIHLEVIKIIFESNENINNLFKLHNNSYLKLKDVLKNSIISIQICKRLKWKFISKKLKYINFLYNKDNIIFFMDRLNKTILPDNFDTRIKRILLNPFEMFKFLKKNRDFIKWTKFLKDKIKDLYDVPLIFQDSEIEKLGNLIYLLLNIKTQNLKDQSYIKFLNYCKNNEKLILHESRINIKIKEKFKFMKLNINLGYLAKHLTWDNNSIFLKEYKNDNDLEEQLTQMSKKYYKYKGKYIKLKNDTITTIESDSSKDNKNTIEL
jgi:hypothetical protein